MRKRTALGAVLVAAAIPLSACGDAGNLGEAGGEIRQGGTLTVGAAQGIPQLNPAIRTFAWEEALFPLLWNGLTKTDKSGKIVPDLAESWKASQDQLTWTFQLRSGVMFNNGKKFTADEVVRAFDYYLDDDTATQEANKLAAIKDVKATNKSTVTFTLSEPVATFPAAIVWVKMIDLDSLESIDKKPVGTGPYEVSEFTPDASLTLVRSDDHFGERAALDEIKFVKASESTSAVTALRSGGLDVVWSVPQGDVAQFEGGGDIVLVRPDTPSQWPSWEMDTTSPPFDDVDARRALAYATDRQAILEAAYFGQGAVSPTNNALGEENRWYGGELTDYSYDLDKAKELFARAGVTEGDTLTWWGVAGQYPEWKTSGEILQASLKEIGINLKIDNNEIATWADKFYPAGKSYPDTIVPNFQSTPPEPAYSLNFYLDGRCECNWSTTEFEKAFAAAVAEPDEGLRKEKWATVQETINSEVPLIVPLQSTVVTATRSNVGGVWVEGGGQLHLESAGLTRE